VRRRKRAVALLERFGLAEKRNDFPDSLSDGQQQRVAIVRALAMRPDLMLLDEVLPRAGPPEKILSEPSQARTQQFLQRIIEAGRL
jgi:energy-coupling factor transporter ATP-binding protein EcfA2